MVDRLPPDGLAGVIRTHVRTPGAAVRLASSFVAILSAHDSAFAAGRQLRLPSDPRSTHLVSSDGRAELVVIERETCSARGASSSVGFGDSAASNGERTFLIGDDSEWVDSKGLDCLGHAGVLRWESERGALSILGSIVGLPPVYVCRRPGALIVTSALHLLPSVARLRLSLDPRAARELFLVGYPLDGRTLFQDVTLMPAGYRLDADTHGRFALTRQWDPSVRVSAAERRDAVEAEAGAFKSAVRRLHLGDSLFSMTGGLDTRAILAVLTSDGIRPAACTMTGSRTICLDARIAAALCEDYGMRHVVVTLGDDFSRELPFHVLEASRLSGGLASVEQAHEVHFYRALRGLGRRRLSGVLGNQVGRQGVEAVSPRRADASILGEGAGGADPACGARYWLETGHAQDRGELLRVLLEREVATSSLANFSIGHEFMVQQTPYADRQLIETVLETASRETAGLFPGVPARWRDVGHRFLGQPLSRSFQRRVVLAAGGAAACRPINWGWRVDRGLSFAGIGWGLLAFADALAASTYPRSSVIRGVLTAIGADGVHEIKRPHVWLDTVLRDFVHDTLQSADVTASGLFAPGKLASLLDEHYRGIRFRHATLAAALDLALAQQLFC